MAAGPDSSLPRDDDRPAAQRTGSSLDDPRTMVVEIAWVGDSGQVERRSVRLAGPATIDDALAALDAAERGALLGKIADGRLQTAIYGDLRDRSHVLHANDRIELLADLAADPKVARRLRVQQRRSRSPGSKW